MAYFSNGSEGEVFDAQCDKCKYGMAPCPVAAMQACWNYDQVGNEVARQIMDNFVKQDGTCTVFEMAKKDFEIDPNQTFLTNL